MRKKFWNKATIANLAGALAYAVTILVLFVPVKEGNQMSHIIWNSPFGLIVLALFGTSLILYFISIFKREKVLKIRDVNALLGKRKEILPKLQNNINEKLGVLSQLVIQASNFPLDKYKEKYITSNPFHKHIKKPSEILLVLGSMKFLHNNQYYRWLKNNNAHLDSLKLDYDSYLAQIEDKKLNKKLEVFWKQEHYSNSEKVFQKLSENNEGIKHTPIGLNLGNTGVQMMSKELERYYKDVMARIALLSEGDDLSYEL